jgi:hypothetical protein
VLEERTFDGIVENGVSGKYLDFTKAEVSKQLRGTVGIYNVGYDYGLGV